MAYKSFQAAKREATREPIEFELQGERFTCVGSPTLGATADFVSTAEKSPLLGLISFVQSVLTDADNVSRFDALLHDQDNPVDGDTLSELASWLMEQYSGKSGESPQDSASTDSPTGPGLKLASAPPDGPPTSSA